MYQGSGLFASTITTPYYNTARPTPVDLNIHCYDGSNMDMVPFSEWFGQFRTVSGRTADPSSLDTLIEICGPRIGYIHTPAESAAASDIGWVYVGVDASDNRAKCYSAVRLASYSKTVVIDLFGVHDSIRRMRVGESFYNAIMADLRPRVLEHIGIGQGSLATSHSPGYMVTLQSTFDYASYSMAVLNSSWMEKETETKINFVLDKELVSKSLTGACQFWRSVGFASSRLEFSGESMVDPILIMWQEHQ